MVMPRQVTAACSPQGRAGPGTLLPLCVGGQGRVVGMVARRLSLRAEGMGKKKGKERKESVPGNVDLGRRLART